MSSPNVRMRNIGKLVISIYDYPNVGDTLPKHVHDVASEHTIEVQRGRIKLRVWQPDGSLIETEHDATADSGWFMDTNAGYPHEVVALTDGARTVHTQKHTRELTT